MPLTEWSTKLWSCRHPNSKHVLADLDCGLPFKFEVVMLLYTKKLDSNEVIKWVVAKENQRRKKSREVVDLTSPIRPFNTIPN